MRPTGATRGRINCGSTILITINTKILIKRNTSVRNDYQICQNNDDIVYKTRVLLAILYIYCHKCTMNFIARFVYGNVLSYV